MSTSERTDDIVEIGQLLAKYAVTMTKGDVDGVVSVFTPTAPTAPSATCTHRPVPRSGSSGPPRACS